MFDDENVERAAEREAPAFSRASEAGHVLETCGAESTLLFRPLHIM